MSTVSLLGSPGRWLLAKLAGISDQAAFFFVCLRDLRLARRKGRLAIQRVVVQQIFFTAVQSVEIIIFLAVLLGALAMIQGVVQLERLGSLDQLSTLIIAVLIREIGPMLTAVILILRTGSAIAMETGYMQVLGENEGLEMQGISVFHFLALPRIVGVMISVFCLIIIFDLAAVLGGFLAFTSLEGVNVWNFVYNLASSITVADFMLVVFKGIIFGLIIPVVCLYYGFRARGAITSVPPQVSRALVDCLIYCVLFNILISAIFLS